MATSTEQEIKAAIESATRIAGYDPESLARILSSPPFITVEGVINFRDIGGVHVPASFVASNSNDTESNYRLKPSIFFRSGELTRLTPNGLAKLRDELRITTIFDLRSKKEVERWKAGTPGVGVGRSEELGDEDAASGQRTIKVVRVPVAEEHSEEFNPAVLAQKVQSFEANEQEAFATLYSDVLTKGAPAFETILKHLRDNPDEPCLVHCTAGKDRTGIIAAIVLLLLHAPEDAIVKDYALTTAGLQPALPFLVARFKKEPAYQGNWKGVEKMASAREETMRATLKMIKEKFGGAEVYVKTYTSLSDEDILTIRRNLIIQG